MAQILRHIDGIRAPKRRKSRVKTLIVAFAVLVLSILIYLNFPWLKSQIVLAKAFGISGKYLVLFQNNTEIRPTGGFIGSFAVVDVQKGRIKTIYYDTNIYKRDKAFIQKEKVVPPYPLDTFCPKGAWQMRDSNWAVDFPEAAQKVAWFYEQEGGEDVQGVLAINATVFQDLLIILGPIELKQYNLVLDSNNFLRETQYQVEKAYFENELNRQTNEPKTIIKDIMPEVLKRLKSWRIQIKLVSFIQKQLKQKQVLFYSRDTALQEAINSHNWGGRVKDAAGDYLYINNANLATNKSSLNISESVNLDVKTDQDKTINKLVLTREHRGSKDWPDGDNRNYTRILAPKGSKLISCELKGKNCADEVKIQDEAGKTAFGLWLNTGVGESSKLTMIYESSLVFKKSNDYSLLWQKQPGALGDNLQVVINGVEIYKGWVDKDIFIK